MLKILSRIPESPSKDARCIIMLHGVGSNQDDLFGLAPNFPEDIYIFSLQGCFSLGGGWYAWYPVDFSTGKPLYNREDVEKGYEYILDCIKDITEKYQLSPEQIFLLGFSQWAIMSYYTLYRSPGLIGGIIALSGRILAEIDISQIQKESYSTKRVFIWHGNQDRVIGVESSHLAAQLVQDLSIEPMVRIYPIGHNISHDEISDIVGWLKV